MSKRLVVGIVAAACLTVASRGLAQSPDGAFTCEFLGRDEGRVGNGATIEGDLGANDPGGFLRLGRKTQVSEDATVSGDEVSIGNGSVVPVVAANALHAPKASVGSVSGAMLPLTDPFCPIPPLECGGPEVRVERGESTGPLTPGSYGEVVLQNGSTLVLGAGAYRFCALRAGRNATIEVLGPGQTTIDVAGDLRLENGSTLAPSASAPTPIVNVGGTAAHFGANVVVEAFVSAPEARLRLGRASRFTGAFCADRFGTGRNVVLTCAEPPPTTTTTTTTSTTTSSTPASTTTSTTGEETTTTTSSSTTTTIGEPTTTTTSEPTATTTVPSTTTSSTPAPTSTTSSTVAPGTTTSSTAAPTTTSSTEAPTTTTSSTTTTTMPAGVVCGAQNFLDVTVTLQYPPIVGGVSGVTIGISYPPPLAVLGSGPIGPQRVTNLLGAGFAFQRVDRDTNADTVDDLLDVTVSSGTNIVPTDETAFVVRYDCPVETPINPASLSCATSNAIDTSGLPFAPELAMQVTCSFTLSVP